MKLPLFASLILLLNLGGHNQSDCKQFRNGKFKSNLNGYSNYYIERSGAVQKEYLIAKHDTLTLTLNVKWLDDCTYTLTPDEETRIKTASPKNALMTVKIISTTPNSYTQTASTNFTTTTTTSEFIKID